MSEIKNIESRCKCPVSLLWISLLLIGFASSHFCGKGLFDRDYSERTSFQSVEPCRQNWMVSLPRMMRHVSINY